MLVRITNRCRMGCRHCFIEAAGPQGEHMSGTTFDAVLRFHTVMDDPLMMISGGEPFEHPQIFDFIDKAQRAVPKVAVLSNGMFADDPKLYDEVQRRECAVQVTNDSDYYPSPVAIAQLQKLPEVYVEKKLRSMVSCRRTRQHGIVGTRKSPMCFNLRSTVRLLKDFRLARMLLMIKQFFCSPSINIDGSLRLGETDWCWNFGDVWMSLPELTERILAVDCCDACGLFSQLSAREQLAITG